MKSIFRSLSVATVAGLGWVPVGAWADLNPIYNPGIFQDAVTGDNAFIGTVPGNNDNKRYWDIDAGADSYQNEYYERPTVKGYKAISPLGGGSARYAVDEYFANLDIVSAQFGYDSQYMYFRIDLYDRYKGTSDGVNTPELLDYEYGVRFSSDPDGRFGYLARAIQPESKHGTTFGLESNFLWQDSDGDVGGRGLINGAASSGRSVTKEDEPLEESGPNGDLNGYNSEIKSPLLYSRIDPNDNTAVEIALDYLALGLDPSSILYLDFQAIKGDPEDPAKYFWNDKYDQSEAGSPYPGLNFLSDNKSEFGTQGLENIYELDTLHGVNRVIPAPGAAVLGLIGLSCISRVRRRCA